MTFSSNNFSRVDDHMAFDERVLPDHGANRHIQFVIFIIDLAHSFVSDGGKVVPDDAALTDDRMRDM